MRAGEPSPTRPRTAWLAGGAAGAAEGRGRWATLLHDRFEHEGAGAVVSSDGADGALLGTARQRRPSCDSQQVKVLERKVERERLMAALSALGEALQRLAKEHGRLTVASAVRRTGG